MGKYIIMAAILGLSLLVNYDGAQAAAVTCQKLCGPKADGSFWHILCTCKSCSSGNAGGGVNCNCGGQSCTNALTGQGGNPLQTGNSALNSGFNDPAAGRMMTMDPITARQRWQMGLNYAFRDRNLAARADWRSLRFGSQSEMTSDFEKTKRTVEARQNFLISFFRYPTMDLTRVDFTGLGFTSTDELKGWIDSISATAFETH